MRKLLILLVGIVAFMQYAHSQNVDISGKVADDKGNPIPGVSVQERSSKRGTTTDINGLFKLSVKPGTTLIFSSVGFDNKQVVLNNSTTQNIVLTPSNLALSEVVVTGVGAATSKKKIAFAIETVNLSNQTKVSSGDVGQQLVGQVAGAQISSTNGNPGQPLNIILRGINTVQTSTLPMILLDGLQVGATDLNSIDINIIDRVEVVQGSAAATFYGAQGANGVIQLFTKKAKPGKINIDVSSSVTTTALLNVGNVHKADKHAFTTDAAGNAIKSDGSLLMFDSTLGVYDGNVQYNALGLTSYAEKPYVGNLKYYDHYKEFFQNGYVFNNSVTVSGIRDKVDFLFSASDNKQNSNFKNNGDYRRSNLTGKLGIELAKGLKLTSLTQLIYTKNTLNDQTGRGIVYALNNTRPFANYQYKDFDGNYGVYVGDAAGVNAANPNYINQYTSTLINKTDIIQSFDLNYRFPKFLELDAKYTLNARNENTNYRYEDQEFNQNAVYNQFFYSNYNPNQAADGSTTGEIDNYVKRTTFQNFIGTATVRTDFDKDFHIKIPLKTVTILAYDYRKTLLKEYNSYAYDAPAFSPWNSKEAAVFKVFEDRVEPFITYGFLANQRFEWGDIAGVSAGIRSDFSSAFGSGAVAQTFPRGDAYLNVSKFKFWENSKISNVFNDFKIRAAYGEAGIQPKPFDRFPKLNPANLGAGSFFTYPTVNPNPLLEVEISKETELGVDLGFKLLKGSWLQNANFSFTWWKRSTDNAIYATDAAPSTGVGSVLDNAFGMGSNGIQASLNLNMLNSKNFSWSMTTNFTKQTSEITSIKGPDVVILSSAGSTGITLKPGYKIGQLFGFLVLKDVNQLDPNTGLPFIAKADQANYEVASNGYVVSKATHQPVSSPTQYAFGDPNPTFNMSFINNFSYKGYLSFSFQWDWVYGSHLYNQTKEWMYRDGISGDYTDQFSIGGVSHAYTAFYRGIYQAGANNGTKDYFYEGASFGRLRNVSIAFDFAKVFKIKGFQRLQLVASGRNLVTVTKYTGYDPETSSGTANSTFDRGVDHNSIPNTRGYTIGLNVGL
ncbi:MAG TPA: SusC/RagA family TonB-linked outer membrane protein [Chitinophagaceae bacterium]|nr:SusC/RagA family TonB-linked outer membrane protein [Chitinophagaceae bacterium]